MNLRDMIDGKFCIGAQKALAIQAGGPGSGRRKGSGQGPREYVGWNKQTRQPDFQPKSRNQDKACPLCGGVTKHDPDCMNRGIPLKAGGPGSGRHPSGIAKEYGYQKISMGSRGYRRGEGFSNYHHPEGHSMMIKQDGRWLHRDNHGTVRTGKGGNSLDDLLSKLHEAPEGSITK